MTESVDVLLIEPDLLLGNTYQAMLKKSGLNVVVVTAAEHAIEQVDAGVPRLIVLELQLAEHNGIEFLHELRSYPEWQSIPVVILSQVPPTEAGITASTAKQLGIIEYCYKSQTNLKQLLAAVEAGLEHEAHRH